jgi:hypothetical protein
VTTKEMGAVPIIPPALIDKLRELLTQIEQAADRFNALHVEQGDDPNKDDNDVMRAFMIEVLLILRYLTRNDLRLAGEISRKLQKAVGDARVEGT